MKGRHILFAFLVSGCGEQPPEIAITQWSLQQNPSESGYTFQSNGTYTSGKTGLFHHSIEGRDERGCIVPRYVEAVRAGKTATSTKIDTALDIDHRLASATLTVRHWTTDMSAGDQGTVVFSESKVLDSSLNPPDFPKEPCSEGKKEELRARAKSDPERADAAAIASMGHEEVVATAINTAGFLCARVTDLYRYRDGFMAHCVEYRSGKGRATYYVNTDSMTVTPQ